MHSGLIRALIHSLSDLCKRQLHTRCAGLNDIQHCVLRKWPVCICIFLPFPGQIEIASSPESVCIPLESESWGQKTWSPLVWKQQRISHPLSWGLPNINHIHWRYKKDRFKSSELCCSTRCYRLLSALSQWIGLCFGKHISCSGFEHWFLPLGRGGFKFYFICVLLNVEVGGHRYTYNENLSFGENSRCLHYPRTQYASYATYK